MKKINLSDKEKRILSITLASWGIIMIGSGTILTTSTKPIINTTYSLAIQQKKVAQAKSNEIKLKDITIEINTPLSVDVKDYLENINDLDFSIINALKLDTSMVKIAEAGTYTYTISYQKKKYNGRLIVKEKELPKVDLVLKQNLRLEVGTAIPTEISTYISNTLTEEMRKNIILDLSGIDNTKQGFYKFRVTYNGTAYEGDIEVYTPKPTNLKPIIINGISYSWENGVFAFNGITYEKIENKEEHEGNYKASDGKIYFYDSKKETLTLVEETTDVKEE